VNAADYLERQLVLFDECECPRGGRQPRFFVWENVPGAFSSNNGLDFKAVLEEIGQTTVPMPANGKWAENGVAQLPGCEIAWRIIDAQWFVPQRRKRIFLVADFNEGRRCAKEILFVEPSLRRDFEKGGFARKEFTGDAEASVGVAGECYAIDHVVTTGGNCTAQGPCYYKEISPTLKAAGTHAVSEPIALRMRAGKPGGGKGPLLSPNKSLTLAANANDQVLFANGYDVNANDIKPLTVSKTLDTSFRQVCGKQNGQVVAYSFDSLGSNSMKSSNPNSGCRETETATTLDTTVPDPSKNQGGIAVAYCIAGNTIDRQIKNGGNGKGVNEEVSYTLNTIDRHAVAYDTYQKTVGALCSCDAKQAGSQYVNQDKLVCAVDVRNSKEDIVNGALQSMASNNLNSNNVVRTQYAVRRLTPTECERLQGLPDGYTLIDDKSCSDSARYKALGNGMAQPCADFVIRRIVEEVSKDDRSSI